MWRALCGCRAIPSWASAKSAKAPRPNTLTATHLYAPHSMPESRLGEEECHSGSHTRIFHTKPLLDLKVPSSSVGIETNMKIFSLVLSHCVVGVNQSRSLGAGRRAQVRVYQKLMVVDCIASLGLVIQPVLYFSIQLTKKYSTAICN